LFPSGDEGFLGEVFAGGEVTADRIRDTGDGGLVKRDELTEGGAVAGETGCDEDGFLIGQGGGQGVRSCFHALQWLERGER
jgi:hypothetical protein